MTGGQLNCGGKKYNFKYGQAYLQSVDTWSERGEMANQECTLPHLS